MKIEILEPKNHNPHCLIANTLIDSETMITCAMEIKSKECKMEFYSGENYVPGAKFRSYSRIYSEDKIPKKYKETYRRLKNLVINW